jgi:preprotein translocase subunit SecE
LGVRFPPGLPLLPALSLVYQPNPIFGKTGQRKSMTAQSEPNTRTSDIIRQVLAAGLIIGGIAGFYYFSDHSLLLRVLALVVLVIVSAALVFTTDLGRRTWDFMKESRVEVRKVIWPSRQETTQTTLIVFVMVFIVGLVLWLLDMFLFWGVGILTGQGG